MLKVSAAVWTSLSRLLDEAFDLEAHARATWVAQLQQMQPELAPTVRKLLAAHATPPRADILARLPKLASLINRSRPTAPGVGDRVGPYRLKRELGVGGMADVWLAERVDGAFTRVVALKLPIMNRLRRDLAQRFARERDILARLEHPHIARFYDAGVSGGGLPYLAMEYVDGLPINEYCDAHRLGINARLSLFNQVLEAVQFAHANLVIHRDLKPSNVLVTAAGEVRLLDFGIAKLLAENDIAQETQLTQMAGRALTPDYASPEQIKGEPLTIATDVYSLGVVLYELLVGCRPYRLHARLATQLEDAIISVDPARPSSAASEGAARARAITAPQLSRALSGDLDTITLKALAKSSADRYPTVVAFAEDLQRHLAGRPVIARPTSWLYRAKKFVVRNKLIAGAATGAVLSLMIGAGIAGWQAQQARTDQRRAEQVKAFLASIFVDIDPNYGQGALVPASAILITASRRIDNEFGTDPRLALEVATLVASGLLATSENNVGGKIVEAALQNYEPRLAVSDPQVLRAHVMALRAHATQGTLPPVAPRLPDLIEKLKNTNPPLTEELVFALVSLGITEILAKRPETGLASMAEATEIAHGRLGDHHKATIEALSQWSNMLLLVGKPAEALATANRGVTAARALYPRPHPMISSLERYLANAQMRTGTPKDAATVLAQVLEDEKVAHGPNATQVAQAQYNLGNALIFSGQLQAGLQHLHAADEALLRLVPNDHRNHWARRSNLAGAYLAARLPAEALRILDEADRAARVAGVDVEQSSVPKRQRAVALTRLGRFAEAVAEYKTLSSNKTPASPLEQARTARGLALMARLEGRTTDAVLNARAAVAALEGQPLNVSDRAATRAELGLALLETGDLIAAESALKTSRSEFTEGQVGVSPDVLDVEVALARLALVQGKQNEAVVLLEETQKYWRDIDPTSLDAAAVEYWRARASNTPATSSALKTLRASPYPLHHMWLVP